MNCIPCTAEHLERIQLEGLQLAGGLCASGYEGMETHSRALELEGRILACFGVVPQWKGVGTAWAMLTEEIRLFYPVALSVHVYRNLLRIEKRDQLWRVQATVPDGFWVGRDWLKRMGFEVEAFLRSYGPLRDDHWMMARVAK